jgi:hypothetical protein
MKLPTAKVVSRHPDGIIPMSDGVSFPISIVQRTHNRMDDSVHDYNDFLIGLSFKLPVDHYIELHGTENLLNAGYELPHMKIIEGGDHLEVDNINDRMIKIKKYTDGAMLPLPFYDGLKGIAKQKTKMLLHSQLGPALTDNTSFKTPSHHQPVPRPQAVPASSSSFIIM